jgi:hypothetical protein
MECMRLTPTYSWLEERDSSMLSFCFDLDSHSVNRGLSALGELILVSILSVCYLSFYLLFTPHSYL